jgi:hypothetical protein
MMRFNEYNVASAGRVRLSVLGRIRNAAFQIEIDLTSTRPHRRCDSAATPPNEAARSAKS